MSFLCDFSAGVSVYPANLTGFVHFDGTQDRNSDVVDRAVDVDLIDAVSLSSRESMLARGDHVIIVT